MVSKNSPFEYSVRLHSSRPGPRSASKHRFETALIQWHTLRYRAVLIYVKWYLLRLLLLCISAQFLIQIVLFAAALHARTDWNFANSSLTPSICKRSLYQSLVVSAAIQKQESRCARRLVCSVSWSTYIVLRHGRVRVHCFLNIFPIVWVFAHFFHENMFLMSVRNLFEEKIRDSMLYMFSSVRYFRFGVRSYSFACFLMRASASAIFVHQCFCSQFAGKSFSTIA